MKTSELEAVVKICRGSLMTIDLIPVLTHICFTGSDVYAYNDISAVIVSMETDFVGGVKGAALAGVLDTLGKECELRALDENTLLIESGRAKIKLAAMPESSFMFTPPDEEPEFTVSLDEELLEGLERCMTTVGINALQREYTGVTFAAMKNVLRIFSTDDMRLSDFDYTVPDKVKGRWLVPLQTCKQIKDVCAYAGGVDPDGDGEVLLHFGKTWMWVEGPGIVLMSKLMPETPPDYEAMLEQIAPPDDSWFAVPDGFRNAFARAQVLTDTETQPKVCLESGEKGLTVKLEGSSSGSFVETFKLKGKGGGSVALPQLSHWLDPRKVAQSLNGIAFMAVGERCLAVGEDAYRCYIAPVQVEGEGK